MPWIPYYQLGALGFGVLDQTDINIAKDHGADFLDWNHGSINQAAVDLAHLNGMELHVYTVNTASRMQDLIDLGVDGITTDDPSLLRSLLVPEPSTCAYLLGAIMLAGRLRHGNRNRKRLESFSDLRFVVCSAELENALMSRSAAY